MDGFDDPVDTGITTDGFVLGVNENNFEVFVCRVLVDPVGVQHAQIGAAAADTFFGGGFKGTLVFELVDTLVGGFAYSSISVSNAFRSHGMVLDGIP